MSDTNTGTEADEEAKAAAANADDTAEDETETDTSDASDDAPEGKRWVTMAKACTLSLAGNKTMTIPKGRQLLDVGIADHWFVQHHTDTPPAIEPRAGTPEYALAAARARGRQNLINAAIEQEAADEMAKAADAAKAKKAAVVAASDDKEETVTRPVVPRRRVVK